MIDKMIIYKVLGLDQFRSRRGTYLGERKEGI